MLLALYTIVTKTNVINRHFIVIFNSHTDVELFSFDCYFKVLIKDDEIPVRTSDTIYLCK